MRTARTWDWGRERRRGELHPLAALASSPISASADCITGTIGPRRAARFLVHPYICDRESKPISTGDGVRLPVESKCQSSRRSSSRAAGRSCIISKADGVLANDTQFLERLSFYLHFVSAHTSAKRAKFSLEPPPPDSESWDIPAAGRPSRRKTHSRWPPRRNTEPPPPRRLISDPSAESRLESPRDILRIAGPGSYSSQGSSRSYG